MRVIRILMIAMLSGAACAHASEERLRIEGKGSAATLVMPESVKRAIAKVAPGFRPWIMKNYLNWQEGVGPGSANVPFAAVGDINNDGIDDLVVDGRTQKENMRIVAFSSPQGYRAAVLEHYGTSDPVYSKDYDESGKIHTGFNSFLFFSPEAKKLDKSYAFTVQWIQVRDSNGELEGDGDTADYYYRQGKFEGPCTYWDPCPGHDEQK